MHRGRGLNLIALPPCLIPLDTYISYLSTDFRTYPIPIVFVKPCPVKSIDLSTRCLIPEKVYVRYLERAPLVVCRTPVPLLVLDAEGDGGSWRTRAVCFWASFSSVRLRKRGKHIQCERAISQGFLHSFWSIILLIFSLWWIFKCFKLVPEYVASWNSTFHVYSESNFNWKLR